MYINKPVVGALLFKERGLPVFPVRENDRKPAVNNWQQWAQKSSTEKIQSYGIANPMHNWGFHCTGYTVVDIDVKDNKQGAKSLERLQAQYEPLPKTFTVRTPSGGLHYYYSGQTKKNTRSEIAKGIDTRTHGGYVVIPGSRIEEKAYEIIEDCPIVLIPDWLQELVNAQASEKKKIDAPEIPDIDNDVHVQNAILYLQNAPACTEGDTYYSGEYLLQIFYELRDRGLSQDTAKDLVLEHYNKRCNPPWDMSITEHRQHFEAKARNAYTYAQNTNIGAKTASADFTVIKNDTEDTFQGPKHISEYLGLAPKRRWIIEDWLPLHEVSSIYGKGGSGKSLLAMQLALSVATGQPFLGLTVTTPVPTLCVFCEDSDDELHRRKEAILNSPEYTFARDVEKAPVYLWARVGKENDIARISDTGNDVITGNFKKDLVKALENMPKGHKLLVLDTLSDIYLGNENIREQVNKFVKTHIASLLKDYDCSILILAHPSRTGSNTGDMLSGSTAWENAVRNRLTFAQHKDYESLMILKRIKSNYAKQGEEKILEWDNGRFKEARIVDKATEELSQDDFDIFRALTKFVNPEFERRTITVVSKELAKDIEVAHLLKGKSPATIARRIQKLLQYPKKLDGVIYHYEEVDVDGKNGSRWVVAKEDKVLTEEEALNELLS